MADMLVELIESFISGSESTINSLFNSMLNLVFYIERELMYVEEGTTNSIYSVDFNEIYKLIFNYAIYILVIVFIVKAIKIYLLMKDGDSEQNPIQLVIGMMQAIIIMICFKEIYQIGVGIVEELLNSIIGIINVEQLNLAEALSNQIQGGIFTATACIVLLICWILLLCQFIMKGIELLVMRIAIPFATIGLLSSDNGAFPEYIRSFLMTAFTLIIQMSLVNLSVISLISSKLIYGIAIAVISVNTPMMLNKYIIRPSGSPINALGNTARSMRALIPKGK